MNSKYKQRSLLLGPLIVTLEYFCIFILIAVSQLYEIGFLTIIAVFIIGMRQYSIAEVMTHEASHFNLSKSKILNEIVGRICIWPFFYTLSGYRTYHFEHHRVDLSDQKNNIYEQYEYWGLPSSENGIPRRELLIHLFIKPLTGFVLLRHFWGIIEDLYFYKHHRENIELALFWIVVLSLIIRFGFLMEFLLFWILPQLIYTTMDYWSEIIDHYHLSNGKTRTNGGRVFNFLFHNIGFHDLHHKYPRIPWFRLKRASIELSAKLDGQYSNSYLQSLLQTQSNID